MSCDGCVTIILFLILGKAMELFCEWAVYRKAQKERQKEIEKYLKIKEILRKIDEEDEE